MSPLIDSFLAVRSLQFRRLEVTGGPRCVRAFEDVEGGESVIYSPSDQRSHDFCIKEKEGGGEVRGEQGDERSRDEEQRRGAGDG